jgi:hypothetical protein
MKARIMPIQEGYLADGVTVKLKYDDILSHPNYPRLTEKYRGWVEENKDTVFLVWHNPNYSNRPDLVSLSKYGQKQIWLLTYFDIEEVKVPMCTTCYEEPSIDGTTECKGCRESRLKELSNGESLKEVFEQAFSSEESVTEELEDGAGL